MTLKQLEQKIISLVNNASDTALTDAIGRQVSTDVKKRTRKGFGVSENKGNKERLKPLRKATKRIRKDVEKRGQLSSSTTPNKSNLTRSGRMLNNIGYVNDKDSVTISLKGREQTKAREVSGDRPFMNISKTEFNKVVKLVKNKITNDINKKGL